MKAHLRKVLGLIEEIVVRIAHTLVHLGRIHARMPASRHLIGAHRQTGVDVRVRLVVVVVRGGQVYARGAVVRLVDQDARRLDRIVAVSAERQIGAVHAQIVDLRRRTVRTDALSLHVVHRDRLASGVQLQVRRSVRVADRRIEVVLIARVLLLDRVAAHSLQFQFVALAFVDHVQHVLQEVGQIVELVFDSVLFRLGSVWFVWVPFGFFSFNSGF